MGTPWASYVSSREKKKKRAQGPGSFMKKEMRIKLASKHLCGF